MRSSDAVGDAGEHFSGVKPPPPSSTGGAGAGGKADAGAEVGSLPPNILYALWMKCVRVLLGYFR